MIRAYHFMKMDTESQRSRRPRDHKLHKPTRKIRLGQLLWGPWLSLVRALA